MPNEVNEAKWLALQNRIEMMREEIAQISSELRDLKTEAAKLRCPEFIWTAPGTKITCTRDKQTEHEHEGTMLTLPHRGKSRQVVTLRWKNAIEDEEEEPEDEDV